MQEPRGISERLLHFAKFPNVQGRALGQTTITWGKLVARLSDPAAFKSKTDMPLLKLAQFGDLKTAKGSLRHDANVITVSGVEGDYDAGEVSIEAAAIRLEKAGVEALLYSSPSHADHAPRWRVLAPLAADCDPQDRGRYLDRLNAALGGILAHESRTLSQTYYYGRVEGAAYTVRHVIGEPVDTLDALDVLVDAEQMGAVTLNQGGRNVGLMRRGASLRKAGFELDDIEAKLLAINAAECVPPLDEEEVRDIARKVAAHAPGTPIDDSPLITADDLALVAQVSKPWPVFTRDRMGGIEVRLNNLLAALGHAEMCGFEIAYDRFRDTTLVRVAGSKEVRPITDADQIAIRSTLESHGFGNIGRELFRDAVHLHANAHAIDSLQDWVDSLPPWDGVERIAGFFVDYFGAEDSPYVRAVGRYVWTALAGRAIEPGVKADMAPILVGPQGIRKSTGVAAMAPDPSMFAEVSFLGGDADASRLLRGCVVGEIAELRGLSTRDLESVKQFMTRTVERWIPKYQERETHFPRRCVFVGTTNQDEFLGDETGERRWLPIRVVRGDTDAIKRDRGQLWAEAAARFTVYGVEWSDAETLAPVQHAQHVISDSWEQAVANWVAGSDSLTDDAAVRDGFLTADVLAGALNFPAQAVKRGDEMRVGKVLRRLGFVQRITRDGSRTLRRWFREA